MFFLYKDKLSKDKIYPFYSINENDLRVKRTTENHLF